MKKAVQEKIQSNPIKTWYMNKYGNKTPYEDRTEGDIIEEILFDRGIELEQLKNESNPSTEQMKRMSELQRLFKEDEESDGPTGDPWIDDWLEDSSINMDSPLKDGWQDVAITTID